MESEHTHRYEQHAETHDESDISIPQIILGVSGNILDSLFVCHDNALNSGEVTSSIRKMDGHEIEQAACLST